MRFYGNVGDMVYQKKIGKLDHPLLVTSKAAKPSSIVDGSGKSEKDFSEGNTTRTRLECEMGQVFSTMRSKRELKDQSVPNE
jgi:hypothetical protein